VRPREQTFRCTKWPSRVMWPREPYIILTSFSPPAFLSVQARSSVPTPIRSPSAFPSVTLLLQKHVMDLLDPTQDPLALNQIRGVLVRLEDTIIFCSSLSLLLHRHQGVFLTDMKNIPNTMRISSDRARHVRLQPETVQKRSVRGAHVYWL
jgi:hypothetical protein